MCRHSHKLYVNKTHIKNITVTYYIQIKTYIFFITQLKKKTSQEVSAARKSFIEQNALTFNHFLRILLDHRITTATADLCNLWNPYKGNIL